ncbi:hypothetical protein GOP47_0008778, partial [Adiantum capillus-veneris]
KLVHAAMPHTWLLYMLKHKGTKPGSHHDCKRKSSQRKKPAIRQKKHSPEFTLHHKASDVHFPSTLVRKTSLKACREGPSVKHASRQENLSHCSDVDTECRQSRSLYRCTMSPKSRKFCSTTDVADNDHNNLLKIPHFHALNGDSCHANNASKAKIFQLDVKELEMKLNALRARERWRNTSMSTLPSVAVPSPSLDGEPDYSSYPELDSLATSLRHHLSRRDKCRMSGAKNISHGRHSNLYCSNPGKGSQETNNFLRDLHLNSLLHESYITCDQHQRDLPKTRHAIYLENGDLEGVKRPHLHICRPDSDHNIGEQGTQPNYRQTIEREASAMIKNSPGLRGSLVMQSVKQNGKNREMEYLITSSMEESGSDMDGSQSLLNTEYEERCGLGQLSVSSSDDSDLPHIKMASQNYKSFRMQKKQKLIMRTKGRRCPKHNSIDKYNTPVTTPVHNDFHNECSELRSEFLRSLSTKSLDSSLSHNTFSSTETSFDGDYFGRHQMLPAVSEFSRQGYATPRSSCILAQNVQETCISVDYNDLMHPERNLQRAEKDIGPYEIDFIASTHPVHMAAPVRHDTSSAGKENIFAYNGTPSATADEISAHSEISIMECLVKAGKHISGHAKSSMNTRLNSLNGITGPANQYAFNDQVHIKSSDDAHDDEDDEDNYADDESSVSGFEFKANGVYHILMQGEKSDEIGCYDGGQHDFSGLLADDCGIGAYGYHADGESDEACAGYKESSRNNIDASQSMAGIPDRGIDKKYSSDTALLDRRAQVQQTRHTSRDQLLQAEIMWSYNMYQDFMEAIVANIENMSKPPHADNGGEAQLLELLQCYLALNRRRHHPIIIKAFCDVCEYVKDS